ncbi:MAG TPA: hypothetical protein PKG48_04065 [Bacteroidales bacterium]|nr:hypothetical protein [Bacteroidales bacterium]HPS61619.1 hypothetical protein [Bacteroidales bacterium]
MKTYIKSTLIAGALASLILTGCNKAKDVLPDDNKTSSSSTSINMSDGYGVLAAVRSVSYTTVSGVTVPLEVNTAVAAFNVSMGSSTFTDAGGVTLNGKSLTKSTNNAYVYQDLTNPLTFNTVTWNVAGSSSVPSFSYTDDRPIPDYSAFNSLPTTVTRSAGVTISLGSAVTNADSVYVTLTDYNNHSLLKRVGGSAAGCTFSASELAGFAAGQGMVQVCPWNYKTEDFNDKKFYFIIESAFTKQGITIN